MFNFKDTYAVFSARNACVTVLDGPELARKILEILLDRPLAQRMGQEAAAIVMENRGAAVRTVENLRQILSEQGEIS
jgi:3-deoxy-D-manno-octulosonic-acid transferase